MFTILCYNKTKMMLGNRKGKVFVANTKWYKKYPTIFILPICVCANYGRVVIPECPLTQTLREYCSDKEPDPVGGTITFRILDLQSMGYDNNGVRLFSRCGFDSKQKVWYKAGIPTFFE